MSSSCPFLSIEPLLSSDIFPGIPRLLKTGNTKNMHVHLTCVTQKSLSEAYFVLSRHILLFYSSDTVFTVLIHDSMFILSLSVEATMAKSFWLSRLEAFHFKFLMSLLCQTCSDLSKIVLMLAEFCLIKSRLIKYHGFFSASCCCWAPMNPLKYLNTAVDYWFPKRGRKTGLYGVVIHLQTA